MTRLSQLWWEQFHGPAKFLEEFCREAAQGGCFFLRHAQPIPWYFRFQDLVFERLRREVGHFRLEEPADLPRGAGPQWFVERFLPQNASNFLSTTKLSAFLAQTGGLKRRAVWLRAEEPDQLPLWLEQLSQFAATPASRETIFILEGGGQLPTRRKVRLFDADGAFTAFDGVQLCTIAANEAACPELLKPYVTHLLDQLCGSEPGLVELLLDQGEGLMEDPRTAAGCLDLDADTVDRRVRRAQMVLLLPIVEDMRVALLTQLYDQCKKLLPFEETIGTYTNNYGEVFELEARHLRSFKRSGQLQMSDSQWALAQAAYDVGNHFRHNMNPLSFQRVEGLLRLAESIR